MDPTSLPRPRLRARSQVYGPKRFRLDSFAIVYFKLSPLPPRNSRVLALKNIDFPIIQFHIRFVNVRFGGRRKSCTHAGFYTSKKKSGMLTVKPPRQTGHFSTIDFSQSFYRLGRGNDNRTGFAVLVSTWCDSSSHHVVRRTLTKPYTYLQR